MTFPLPSPCLVLLVGPSGSGKSTWAAENFETNEIVSSDSLRAMVGAGKDDQVAGTAAFKLLDLIVTERLARGMTTVIDTLGFDADLRASWTGMARANRVPVHAVIFETDRELAEQRNSQRPRPIPKTVIGKQYTRFKKVRREIEDEGLDGIHRVIAKPGWVATVAGMTAVDVVPRPTGHTFGLIVSRFNWEGGGMGSTFASVARRAEAAGFRDFWVMDHFRQIPAVGRAWEDIPEAYTALSFAAGVTKSIRLGALVTGITHRNPVVLGKMIATLDVLSDGRAIAGLGAGWDEKEHAAYGIEFPALRDRYGLLEDTLQMLPLLWGKGSPSFSGDYIKASELVCYPRPVQDPIPIMVGGSGEKKTLRLVARYADLCNVFGDPDRVRHKVDVLERHCADFDRDPAEIEVTHLTTILVGSNQRALKNRAELLRDRNTPVETFMSRNNAATPDQVAELVGRYAASGANNTIVSLPDVALDGSIEAFGEVIASLGSS